MSAQRLLIDAGNTRVKWVLVADDVWQSPDSADYADLSALSAVASRGAKCMIASVAGIDQESRLRKVLSQLDSVPRWLTAAAQFLDVKNGYANPNQLGVDRWMGLIAARQRTRAATLVVSLGTAMTVDALSADGVFVGGLIIPGRGMMQQSLLQGAAQVAAVSGAWHAFPQTTADAVQSGIIAAMAGAIQMQHARFADACGCMPQCLLTGGDAAMLLPYLDLPVEHAPFLVLEGIDCVVRGDRPG